MLQLIVLLTLEKILLVLANQDINHEALVVPLQGIFLLNLPMVIGSLGNFNGVIVSAKQKYPGMELPELQ